MIDVKELSIGNWVNYRAGWEDEETGQIVHESGTGFPVKIEMIYFCQGEGLVQYNDGYQNDGIEACDYELFPIEITPEILEKNEWKVRIDNRNPKMWIAFLEENAAVIHDGGLDEDKMFVIINSDGGEIRFAYRYVHQLQNALTLCGIENKIEL